MKKLKLSFLTREFFAGDRTGTTIQGYEPAVMIVNGELKVGRIIDVERLEKAESIDTLVFQTEINLEEGTVDLEQLLGNDKNGKEWLENLQRFFSECYKKPLMTTFSVNFLEPLPMMQYSVMPKDYIERINKFMYEPPEAVIKKLPDTLVYCRVEPPMKFKDGAWIRGGIHYHRSVQGPKGVFDHYSNYNPEDDNKCRYAEGILLGSLSVWDLEDVRGDFEGDTPLNHYLNMVYLTPISCLDKYNPSTIKVELG